MVEQSRGISRTAAKHTSTHRATGRHQRQVPDLRVSKGFGTRDYDVIRVSVVTHGKLDNASAFQYSAPFKFVCDVPHRTEDCADSWAAVGTSGGTSRYTRA